jgi:hypothetical protein
MITGGKWGEQMANHDPKLSVDNTQPAVTTVILRPETEANAAVGGGTPATRHDRLPKRREPVIALARAAVSAAWTMVCLVSGFLRRFAVGRFGIVIRHLFTHFPPVIIPQKKQNAGGENNVMLTRER